MGKIRDLFKKIGGIKATFHLRMGTIKNRNIKNLTKAEEIKKKWQDCINRCAEIKTLLNSWNTILFAIVIFFLTVRHFCLGFPSSSAGKESTCSAGDLGLIPGLGRSPGGGRGNPLQYSCLENSHGQRSQVGYSLWGGKKSDTNEWLSTAHLYLEFSSICIDEIGLFLGGRASVSLPIFYINIILAVWIGEGNGSPLHYSCLENPVDRRAWWAAVYGSHRVRQFAATAAAAVWNELKSCSFLKKFGIL